MNNSFMKRVSYINFCLHLLHQSWQVHSGNKVLSLDSSGRVYSGSTSTRLKGVICMCEEGEMRNYIDIVGAALQRPKQWPREQSFNDVNGECQLILINY